MVASWWRCLARLQSCGLVNKCVTGYRLGELKASPYSCLLSALSMCFGV